VGGASLAGSSSAASPAWGAAGHSLASVLALYVLSPAGEGYICITCAWFCITWGLILAHSRGCVCGAATCTVR